MFILIFFLTLVTVKTSLPNLDLLALPPGNVTSFYSLTTNHNFALSVREAGDVNGDGIGDIIISSPASTGAGVTYIIYGNKNGIPDLTLGSLLPTQGFMIIGPSASVGWAASKAGDLNGDKIDDIIIGSLYEPADHSGTVYVVFGIKSVRNTFTIDPATLQSSGKGFIIHGPNPAAYLGNAVAWAGDVNGDGIDDVIIGAYKSLAVYSNAGKAYVIFGRNAATTPITDIDLSSPLSNTLGFTIQGDASNQFLGASVSSAGDFNGDGIFDIIVGAFRSASQPGTAYVIFGRSGITDITVPSGLTSAEGFQIQGMMNNDFLGFSVSGAGDINHDGFSDVIVGCPQSDSVNSGVAYVIFGKAGPGINIDLGTTSLTSNNLGFKIFTTNIQNKLGYAVKEAGDLNGDGIDDVAVTTLLSGSTGIISTATGYVIFGSKSGLADIDITSLSSNQGFSIQNLKIISAMMLATPLSFAGDVNADGGSDLIIGCPMNINSNIYGSAHLIYGIPVPKPSNPLQVIVDIENFGTAVGRIVAMVSSLFQSESISVIPLWFVFLEQILQYPKYLLIEYPPRLKNIYDDQDFQLFTIPGISEIPNDLGDKATQYSLPAKFEEYYSGSSFLVNFWNSLMTLLIIILIIVIAIVADRCTLSKQSLHLFFSKVKYKLKWNYLISMFTGAFCDIALITSFELRTLHFDSAVEWVSFFLCILVNLVVITVSIKIALIINKFAKRKVLPSQNQRRKRLTKTSQDELKSYQVVFEGFKDQTLKQQSYFLLFSLRFYLFYMIIGYLFEHTLVQAILVNLVGISTLLFLAFVRPFEDKIDFIVSLTQEGALQIIHSCVFLFALDDQVNFASQGFRVVLGDIMLACNAIFMGTSIIYSFILALMLLKKFYLWILNKCCKQNKVNSSKQNSLTLGRIRSSPTASNENKTGLDKVNDSQIYFNREPTVEQELSNLTINMNQGKGNSNVLNNSMVEGSTPQITSSNAILDQNRLMLLNPRREERKRVERETLVAENKAKQERLNKLKRTK